MAYEVQVLDMTFLSAEDNSANIFYAVKKSTSGNLVTTSTTDGGVALGILQNKPKSGQAAVVRLYGISQAVAGDEDLAEGDIVSVDAGGKMDVAGSGDFGIGICLDPGDHTSGRLATVLLLPQGKQ